MPRIVWQKCRANAEENRPFLRF
jgi:hypothetical protein